MNNLLSVDWEAEVAFHRDAAPEAAAEMDSFAREVAEVLGTDEPVTLTPFVLVGLCPFGWEVSNSTGVALYLSEAFSAAVAPPTVAMTDIYNEETFLFEAHLTVHGVPVQRG